MQLSENSPTFPMMLLSLCGYQNFVEPNMSTDVYLHFSVQLSSRSAAKLTLGLSSPLCLAKYDRSRVSWHDVNPESHFVLVCHTVVVKMAVS